MGGCGAGGVGVTGGDACERGAWDHGVNTELAAEFLEETGMADRENADQPGMIIFLNLHAACPEPVPRGSYPPPGMGRPTE